MNNAGEAEGFDGGTMDIDALWAAFHERVHHWLVQLVGTEGDPDDLTICVFFRAWERRDRFSARRGSVCTWLYTITHNIAYSYLRKKRLTMRSLDVVSEKPAPSSDEPVARHEAALVRERVWRAVNALPDRERDVMRLHFQEGLTYGEVAERLGISLRDVMYHVARAVVMLRELLSRQ
jgi:RNA polymerase sigma-70 factor (ECF subfamily)